jgi:hypothetical protein
MRPRHPNKHIEEAVSDAESLGWRVELSERHNWGILFCPERSREGHKIGVHSTPKVPEYHARHIRKRVAKCTHGQRG